MWLTVGSMSDINLTEQLWD